METWVALLVLAAFTGMFGLLMVMALMKASSRKYPSQPRDRLSPEERAAWDQIERHWQ